MGRITMAVTLGGVVAAGIMAGRARERTLAAAAARLHEMRRDWDALREAWEAAA